MKLARFSQVEGIEVGKGTSVNNLSSFALAMVSLTLGIVGCQNTGSEAPALGAKVSSAIAGGTLGSLPAGSSSSFMTVTKVVRSNKSPNTMIELIGTNGEIGANCPDTASCDCQFDFTEANGVLARRFQAPARRETNMLRCLFTQVTSNVGFFDVRVFIKNSSLTSNAVRVFMSAANPSFDPSVSANYLAAQRFMCKDIILKRNFNTNNYAPEGSANLLDPRVWDLSQSYNFYTTSLGTDYGARPLGNSAVAGFECPPIPNDASYDASLDYKIYSIVKIDINSPSTLPSDPPGDFPAGRGDNTIFPSDDSLNVLAANCTTGNEAGCEKFKANRHDFYLATFQDGIFRQPFCTHHTPGNFVTGITDCSVTPSAGPVSINTVGTTGRDVIGFAAFPDADQNCPNSNSVTIPANKKWAKVWKFRGVMEARTLNDLNNPGQIGSLFCTTREDECAAIEVGPDFHSVCHGINSALGPRFNVQAAVSSGGQRFGNCSSTGLVGDGYQAYFGAGGNCNSIPANGTGSHCCLDINLNQMTGAVVNTNRRAANFTAGGDFCNPALIGANPAKDAGGVAKDVWLMGNGGRRPCVEADTDALGKLALSNTPSPNPFDYQPRFVDQNSQFDFLYVVTPPTVKIEQMTDSNSLLRRQYTPKRKARDGVTDIPYELTSASQNLDTATDRLSVFPLCILQDKK